VGSTDDCHISPPIAKPKAARLSDDRSRRIADVADRGLGRLNWARKLTFRDRSGRSRVRPKRAFVKAPANLGKGGERALVERRDRVGKRATKSDPLGAESAGRGTPTPAAAKEVENPKSIDDGS
jgi:hypothetical protein